MRRVQSTLFALLAASGEAYAIDVLPVSHHVYALRMTILWMCILIGIAVFSAMFYTMYHYRKPQIKPAETLWAILSCVMIILMVTPAIKAGFAMKVIAKQEVPVVVAVIDRPIPVPVKPVENAKPTVLPTTPTPVPVALPVKTTKKIVVETNPLKAAMSRGQRIYEKTCAVCHQVSGAGVPPTFPALKGSELVTGPIEENIDRVMNGKPGTAMQAFKHQLNDQQIADVITYERNAWGNDTGDVINPDQIKTARKARP